MTLEKNVKVIQLVVMNQLNHMHVHAETQYL